MTQTSELRNTGVRGWAEFDDFPLLRYYLPSTFTLEGSIEDLEHCRHPHTLIFGNEHPQGGTKFFSFDVKVKGVLKSPKGLIVRFEENTGGGRWRDAVYQVCSTDNNSLKSSLLLYDGGKDDGKKGRCKHDRFRLNGLEGDELNVSQLFLGGREPVDSIIEVFQDE